MESDKAAFWVEVPYISLSFVSAGVMMEDPT